MLAKLFKISRPVSWVNTAYPFAAAYLVTGGGVDLLFVVGTLFFLIPYNLLMYGINDVYDYESDIRNPRKNSIEGAREAKSFHPVILRAAYGLAFPYIVALLLLSDWQSSLVLLAVIFFVIAYSLKGLRFKEKPFIDSITSSLHFVGPMIYALALTGFPAEAWPFVTAFFCWGIASHAFGAVQDVIPDRTGGLASVATVIGARATVWLSAVLYVVAAVLVAPYSIAVAAVGILYVGNVVPYLGITDADSGRSNKGWRRFIWLNLLAGAVVTIVLVAHSLARSGTLG